MKEYIKPNMLITALTTNSHLLTISGDENTKNVTNNGDYVGDGSITLGSRQQSLWDDEDEEY